MRRNPYEKFLTKENRFQRAVAQWLKMQYPDLVWWHTPNEGKRTSFESWLAKVLGIRAGVSDIVILEPNKTHHGLLIELKVGPNKLTEKQAQFLTECSAKGYATHVCYDIEAFMDIVNSYLKAR